MILFFPMLFAILFLMGYYAVFPDQNTFPVKPDKATEQRITGTLQLVAPPTGLVVPAARPRVSEKRHRADETRN